MTDFCHFPRCVHGTQPSYCGNCHNLPMPYAEGTGAGNIKRLGEDILTFIRFLRVWVRI